MDQLASFRFDMWTDGKRDVCALDIRAPEGAPGLSGLWFVLERHELEAIASGKQNAAVDGYHKAEIWGDEWIFYDFNIPRPVAGVMQIPYRKVNIPRTFLKALLRGARRTWALQKKYLPEESYHRQRVEYYIPAEHRARVCRLYGQGLGALRWDVAGDKTAGFLEAARANGGENFSQRLEQIERIARGTTRGFHQTATVRLYGSDPSGFDWCAYTHNGRFIMNGGLINHDRNGGNDWSIHT